MSIQLPSKIGKFFLRSLSFDADFVSSSLFCRFHPYPRIIFCRISKMGKSFHSMNIHAIPQAKRSMTVSSVNIDFVRDCVAVRGINA
jgi:hypothetical protein